MTENNLPAVFSQIDILTADELANLEAEEAAAQGRPLTIYPPSPEDFTLHGNPIQFMPSPSIGNLVEEVISEFTEFSHLRSGVKIGTYWKKGGGKSQKRLRMGDCSLADPMHHSLTGDDFVLWFAADHCRTINLSQGQYWRLAFHQLKHAGIDDDTDAFKINPHDVEAFTDEIKHFGPWTTDLEHLSWAMEEGPDAGAQLPLGIKL